MEATCHDTVCCVESFLDAITVVDININIQDTLVVSEEFKNAEDDVWMVSLRTTCFESSPLT